ncbi:MAG TPA: hypothetical protein VEA40_05345 [Ramlibacter sp.]|nr:hypothetical protein [Ramlibacter sp.]
MDTPPLNKPRPARKAPVTVPARPGRLSLRRPASRPVFAQWQSVPPVAVAAMVSSGGTG